MIRNRFWYVVERSIIEEINDFVVNCTIITLSINHYFPSFVSGRDIAEIHFREREEKGWRSIYDRGMLTNYLFLQPEV